MSYEGDLSGVSDQMEAMSSEVLTYSTNLGELPPREDN